MKVYYIDEFVEIFDSTDSNDHQRLKFNITSKSEQEAYVFKIGGTRFYRRKDCLLNSYYFIPVDKCTTLQKLRENKLKRILKK
jgi:hypothetical protein